MSILSLCATGVTLWNKGLNIYQYFNTNQIDFSILEEFY